MCWFLSLAACSDRTAPDRIPRKNAARSKVMIWKLNQAQEALNFRDKKEQLPQVPLVETKSKHDAIANIDNFDTDECLQGASYRKACKIKISQAIALSHEENACYMTKREPRRTRSAWLPIGLMQQCKIPTPVFHTPIPTHLCSGYPTSGRGDFSVIFAHARPRYISREIIGRWVRHLIQTV